MKIEKPSYYLKIHMADCPRQVSINGIELERDFAGSTSSAEFPINHYIKNGENSFELVVGKKDFMLKKIDENSKCQVEVRVRGELSGKQVDYKVSDITYTPNYTDKVEDLYSSSMPSGSYKFSSNNDVALASENADFSTNHISLVPLYVTGAGYTFERKFTAAVPFSKWSFFEAEQIFKMPFDSDEAYSEAEKFVVPLRNDLIKLLATQDVSKILPAFELRSTEIDQAFYKEPGETQKDLKVSLENIFKNDFPFEDTEDEYLQMLVSYDGRLATLVNAADMTGTVHYHNTNADMYIFYTVYWAKKDGRWYIAR